MPLLRVPIEEFGPIRADLDTSEVGMNQSVNSQNIVLDAKGQISLRPQFEHRVDDATHGSDTPYGVRMQAGGARIYTAQANGSIFWWNPSNGAYDNNTVAAGSDLPHLMSFGTPSVAYMVAISKTMPIKLIDNTGTVTVGTKQGYALGQTPVGRRLAVLGDTAFNAATLSFSAQGDPTTFGANDHVTPGDGLWPLTAAQHYEDKFYVFAQHRFWVFTTESTSPTTGNTLFDYYAVDTGIGAIGPYAVGAGKSGVYFMHNDGVYVTQGGSPRKISNPLGITNWSYSKNAPTKQLRVAAGPYGDRVFVYTGFGTTYVWDEGVGWTKWVIPTTGDGGIETTYDDTKSGIVGPRLWIGGKTGNADLWASDAWLSGYNADFDIDGGATPQIVWVYTTGMFPLPEQDKDGRSFLRAVEVTGQRGLITVQVNTQDKRIGDVDDLGGQLDFSADPTVHTMSRNVNSRGSRFQVVLSGAGNFWVMRMALLVPTRPRRQPIAR